jgi:drug/metabolite transporter (DMT)-like permease
MAGPLSAWLAFGYVAIGSQFLAFFAWYKGLALGGIARVSQLQLFQPFITMVASWLLWGEALSWVGVGAALVVAATVALGRRAPVARLSEE